MSNPKDNLQSLVLNRLHAALERAEDRLNEPNTVAEVRHWQSVYDAIEAAFKLAQAPVIQPADLSGALDSYHAQYVADSKA
jgi:hypothetical protein